MSFQLSPSCVAYFDDYAETASLLATGVFNLRQPKGGDPCRILDEDEDGDPEDGPVLLQP